MNLLPSLPSNGPPLYAHKSTYLRSKPTAFRSKSQLVKNDPEFCEAIARDILDHLQLINRKNEIDEKIPDLLSHLNKVIELNPHSITKIASIEGRINGATLLTEVMFIKECEERTKLVNYLLIGGASYTNRVVKIGPSSYDKGPQDLAEMEQIQQNIAKTFKTGLERIKLIDVIYSGIPKEVKWMIITTEMHLYCPYLFNFPAEFLRSKIGEYTHTPTKDKGIFDSFCDFFTPISKFL